LGLSSSSETAWDRAEPKLRPRSPEQARKIDKAIDAALQQLRADSPQAATAKEALQNLLAEFDQSNEKAMVAPGNVNRLTICPPIGSQS
jgi:hypothetical protein